MKSTFLAFGAVCVLMASVPILAADLVPAARDERSRESDEVANDLLSGKVKAPAEAADEKAHVYFTGDCKDESGHTLNRGEKGYDECLKRVKLSPRVSGEASVGTQVTTPGVGVEFKSGK